MKERNSRPFKFPHRMSESLGLLTEREIETEGRMKRERARARERNGELEREKGGERLERTQHVRPPADLGLGFRL